MVEGRNHGAIRREEREKVKGYYSICAIGGMLSAGTTHLAITPLDVLKVNMQDPQENVHFLYRNVLRTTKEDCSKAQQLGVTCLAGYAAGSVGSFISNPADNIVASLYNKKADSLMLAVKKIGLINLFTRSLPIRIMLVGPVVTLQWFFYDTIKVLSGLPTSGEVTTEVEVDGNIE